MREGSGTTSGRSDASHGVLLMCSRVSPAHNKQPLQMCSTSFHSMLRERSVSAAQGHRQDLLLDLFERFVHHSEFKLNKQTNKKKKAEKGQILSPTLSLTALGLITRSSDGETLSGRQPALVGWSCLLHLPTLPTR